MNMSDCVSQGSPLGAEERTDPGAALLAIVRGDARGRSSLVVEVVAHEESADHGAGGEADLDASEPVVRVRIDGDHDAPRSQRGPHGVSAPEGADNALHRAPYAPFGEEFPQWLQGDGEESRPRGRLRDGKAVGTVSFAVVSLHGPPLVARQA